MRRRTIIVISALAVLPLLAVVADRGAAELVESRIAGDFQDGMDTPNEPSVHVRGFPVLTQMSSGTLDRVDIDAHDIPADGSTRPVPVSELDVRLDGVSTSGGDGEARARKAEATALLTYQDLTDSLGLEIGKADEPGRIKATAALPFGDELTVTVGVSAASGNRIAFEGLRVDEGDIPDFVQDLLDNAFDEPLPLENLPEGLNLRTITVTDAGISAYLTGKTVTFRPDSSSA
nr:DUF2993 domain-containing protein [Streptomyces sp. SID5914]